MDFFLKGEDDEAKQNILGCNQKMWRAIRGEVKEWVLLNYWTWEADRPEWFTESWIAKIPPDMIPPQEKAEAKAVRVIVRQRSSFAVVAQEGKGQIHPVE